MPPPDAVHEIAAQYPEIADGSPIPNTPALIPLHRLGDTPAGRNAPLGVRIPPTTSLDRLAEIAGKATMIAIEFPIFRDGRGFTLARTLREYHQYAGEIRAVGHILPDQHAFLARCGFTMPPNQDPHFRTHYQHAVGDPTSAD